MTAPAPMWQSRPTIARAPRTAFMSIIVRAPTSAPMLMTAPIMITQSLPIRAPSLMKAPGSTRASSLRRSSIGRAEFRAGDLDMGILDSRPAALQPRLDGRVVADEHPERALAEGLKAAPDEFFLPKLAAHEDFGRRLLRARGDELCDLSRGHGSPGVPGSRPWSGWSRPGCPSLYKTISWFDRPLRRRPPRRRRTRTIRRR